VKSRIEKSSAVALTATCLIIMISLWSIISIHLQMPEVVPEPKSRLISPECNGRNPSLGWGESLTGIKLLGRTVSLVFEKDNPFNI